MKKILSIMLVLFLIPVAVIFSSCTTVEEIAGTYHFSELYLEGKTYKVGDVFGDATLSEESAVLVLNNDEEMTATYTDLDYKSLIEGGWRQKENLIIFVSKGLGTVEMQFQLREKDGGVLLIIDQAETILLKKVEEPTEENG